MPNKKRANKKQPTIKIGNISDVSGNVNVAGGNITTHQTTVDINTAQIKRLFDQIYEAIENHIETSSANKEDIKVEVKEIQSTVTKAVQNNAKVNEGFLSRRFRNIARISPDVLDVVVAALGNPLAGLGVAARRLQRRQRKKQRNHKCFLGATT